MMKSMSDLVVLVTGAGRGVGRALALAFANRGARVAIQDITPVNLDETLKLVHTAGVEGLELIGDMSKKMQVQRMIEAARESLGEINILVNQATVAPAVDLLSIDEWDWDRTMGVNLKGYFLALQSIGRLMRERNQGLIINMVVPPTRFIEAERHPAYEVAAAGIRELTRHAADELGPYGVRVFAVEASRKAVSQPKSGRTTEETDLAWWQRDPEILASVVLDICAQSEKVISGRAVIVDEGGRV
jgi:NAD(P)-dependent dehydrogenase (short-subunit alcohol dehydrogenase family)